MGSRGVRALTALLVASICIVAETALADEIRVMSSNAFRQASRSFARIASRPRSAKRIAPSYSMR